MKKKVFVIADNIISPIGFTSEQNFVQIKNKISGIQLHHDTTNWTEPFQASLFDKDIAGKLLLPLADSYTFFEKLLIESIHQAALKSKIDLENPKTIFIISTTKGNISLLENENDQWPYTQRISLHHSAKLVSEYFGNPNQPIVISNACISGVLALITGMRLIQSGLYDHAVIAGADLITKFILSGFFSFQAISEEPCKPFDKSRNGLTLGEAAGTIILSSQADKMQPKICIAGGATTNDANHISGPSRTGEELSVAINQTIAEAGISHELIDFISLHGTATLYNDEMEANALTLSNLQNTFANSLKGYFGHTLGAAGIIETVMSVHSMKNNLLIPTLGYQESDVSKQIKIIQNIQGMPLNYCLKTASGFGGCNASLLLSKN